MSELVAMRLIGLGALKKSLEKKARKLENRKAANAKSVVVTDRWIQKNFQQEGRLAHPGTGWKELSPVTIAMRRKGPRKTGKVMILQDTGTMRSRWKHFWDVWTAKIQAGVDYAYRHHYGKGNVPVRRILPTKKQIEPEIKEVFRHFIESILK